MYFDSTGEIKNNPYAYCKRAINKSAYRNNECLNTNVSLQI